MKMFIKIIICCVVFIVLIHGSASVINEPNPIVTLPKGKIRGHVLKTDINNIYYAFQEIPYASPPVGSLRFQEPQEPTSWNGILETTKNTKICYQQPQSDPPTPNVSESEDCLYLNVYTPLKPGDSSATPLPVLVWIHGGGFIYGDGTFQLIGPQFFIDYDLVVVVMNYRLGALGFLSTEDGVIPGNIGLKDQLMALQWVKNNIKLFGGDPEKITIAGESAGAASVGFHLISEKTKGLYRAVIMESGNALCAFAHQNNARYFAFQLGRILDPTFTSGNSTDLLKLLQNQSPSDIMLTEVTPPVGMETGIGLEHAGLIWLPIVENENLRGTFITNPMHEDVRNGNINKVPTFLGFNSEEYINNTGYDKSVVEALAAYLDAHLDKLINNNFKMTDENKLIAGSKLRDIYTNGEGFQNHLGPLIKFMTDVSFATPTIREAVLQASYSDVYLYQFSYQGLLGQFPGVIEGIDDLDVGVAHAEDIRYMWSDSRNSDVYKFAVAEVLTQKRLLKLWSNFVKYLNPTPTKDPLLQNVIWPKVTPTNITYLNIDSTLQVRTDPKQYRKWAEIIDQYAVPPLINY